MKKVTNLHISVSRVRKEPCNAVISCEQCNSWPCPIFREAFHVPSSACHLSAVVAGHLVTRRRRAAANRCGEERLQGHVAPRRRGGVLREAGETVAGRAPR